MNILIRIGRKLIGLFIDEGSLALAILALLGVVYALTHAFLIETRLGAVLLLTGSAAALVENIVRSARRYAASRVGKRDWKSTTSQ